MNILKLEKTCEIFRRYCDPKELIFCCVTDKFSGPFIRKVKVSNKDKATLENMGWFVCKEEKRWKMYA